MKYKLQNSIITLAISEVLFWLIAGVVYFYFNKYVVEFRFEKPIYLWGIVAVRALLLIFLFSYINKNKRLKKFASKRMRKKLIEGLSTTRVLTKFLLLLYGLSFLIIGWANPQFGKNEKKMKTSGIDIMVALDVSNSMLAKDLDKSRNRLEVAKLAISKLLRQLKGDRVGVVVFAGTAYNFIPITNDYDYIKTEMLAIDPGMISTQGTALGAAIEVSMQSFEEESKTQKAILLFTDGENHEDNAIQLAKNAIGDGIKIFTVGMGTNKAVPIPKRNGKGYHTDKNGTTVLTKLNPEMLQDIAKMGGGIYEQAKRTNVEFDNILSSIGKIEKSTFKQKTFLEYEDRFQWFLAIGILLIILNTLIPSNKKVHA